MLRKMIRVGVRALFLLLTRLRIEGLENIPDSGGYLIAINHLSRLDAPLVYAFVNRDNLTALVADKYQKYPIIRWFSNTVNAIWINREEVDLHALRAARTYLRAGGGIGISPEGTRSPTASLQRAKTGVAYLADKAEVPIVPTAVYGTEDAFHKLFRLQRPRITCCFGEPFYLPPVDRRNRTASLEHNTDLIMCRIAALLPPGYRGVYADHPCLDEFSAAAVEPAGAHIEPEVEHESNEPGHR